MGTGSGGRAFGGAGGSRWVVSGRGGLGYRGAGPEHQSRGCGCRGDRKAHSVAPFHTIRCNSTRVSYRREALAAPGHLTPKLARQALSPRDARACHAVFGETAPGSSPGARHARCAYDNARRACAGTTRRALMRFAPAVPAGCSLRHVSGDVPSPPQATRPRSRSSSPPGGHGRTAATVRGASVRVHRRTNPTSTPGRRPRTQGRLGPGMGRPDGRAQVRRPGGAHGRGSGRRPTAKSPSTSTMSACSAAWTRARKDARSSPGRTGTSRHRMTGP